MDKLTLAHDWYIKYSEGHSRHMVYEVEQAWIYADMMQAEVDKRNTNKGGLTEDESGNCMHFHTTFGRRACLDCGDFLEEWKPDWSQAPDTHNWFAVDRSGVGVFFPRKPKTIAITDNWLLNIDDRVGDSILSSSFNYQGNWKDSLRERPKIQASEVSDMVNKSTRCQQNTMKEYLEPMPNGDYRYHKDEGFCVGGAWIEIPEGSEIAIEPKITKGIAFYRNDFRYYYSNSSLSWKCTQHNSESLAHWKSWRVRWKREKVK